MALQQSLANSGYTSVWWNDGAGGVENPVFQRIRTVCYNLLDGIELPKVAKNGQNIFENWFLRHIRQNGNLVQDGLPIRPTTSR